MRRVVIERAGGHDRLEIREQPDPTPGPGEVRVRTEAIGVNYADCMVRMGLYESAKEYVGWPITPGFEFAGVVDEVGEGVNEVEQGQRVFGVTRFGAYSSHVVTPAALVLPVPHNLTTAQAGGVLVVFLTAWYALCELVRLRPGQKVLVHSAAGGVGGALVQLAGRAGCQVTGIVGASHKLAGVRELGADHVVDKSKEPLWDRVGQLVPSGFDVVLDANGAETLQNSYRHLAPGGKLVVYGFHGMLPRSRGKPSYLKLAWNLFRIPRFHPLRMTNDNRSVLAFNLSYLFDQVTVFQEATTQLSDWLEAGEIRPLPVTEYDFHDVARAHQDLESGRTTGKLILRV